MPMKALAICDSGNYAIKLCSILERQIDCEVVATPCKLAREGCSYCLKFNYEDYNYVKKVAAENGIRLRAAYKIEQQLLKNNYLML